MRREVKAKVVYGKPTEPFRVDRVEFSDGYHVEGHRDVEKLMLEVGVHFMKSCSKPPIEVIFRW